MRLMRLDVGHPHSFVLHTQSVGTDQNAFPPIAKIFPVCIEYQDRLLGIRRHINTAVTIRIDPPRLDARVSRLRPILDDLIPFLLLACRLCEWRSGRIIAFCDSHTEDRCAQQSTECKKFSARVVRFFEMSILHQMNLLRYRLYCRWFEMSACTSHRRDSFRPVSGQDKMAVPYLKREADTRHLAKESSGMRNVREPGPFPNSLPANIES